MPMETVISAALVGFAAGVFVQRLIERALQTERDRFR